MSASKLPEYETRLREQLAQGVPGREIATTLGISYATVTKYKRLLGVKANPRPKPNAAALKRAARKRAYMDGGPPDKRHRATAEEVEAALGSAEGAVMCGRPGCSFVAAGDLLSAHRQFAVHDCPTARA